MCPEQSPADWHCGYQYSSLLILKSNIFINMFVTWLQSLPGFMKNLLKTIRVHLKKFKVWFICHLYFCISLLWSIFINSLRTINVLTARISPESFTKSHTKMHDNLKGQLALNKLAPTCDNLFREFTGCFNQLKGIVVYHYQSQNCSIRNNKHNVKLQQNRHLHVKAKNSNLITV